MTEPFDDPLPDAAELPDIEQPELDDVPLSMTTPADATKRHTTIPPALVEHAAADAEALKPVARAMAAVNLHNLFERIQHPNTNNKDRMEFQALLNKMGGLEAKQASAGDSGPGFSINIVLPGHKKELTIDSSATTVEAE